MTGAGDLNCRIRLDQRAVDANGDRLGAWDTANGVTVWAHVKWLKGGEGIVSQRIEGKQPVAFVVRSSATTRAVTNAYRAVAISGRDVIAGEEFNISGVSPSAQPGYLDILAVRGTATG